MFVNLFGYLEKRKKKVGPTFTRCEAIERVTTVRHNGTHCEYLTRRHATTGVTTGPLQVVLIVMTITMLSSPTIGAFN